MFKNNLRLDMQFQSLTNNPQYRLLNPVRFDHNSENYIFMTISTTHHMSVKKMEVFNDTP